MSFHPSQLHLTTRDEAEENHERGGGLMLPASVRIFVCTVPQDMRRSFDALELQTWQLLGEDPESGGLFVFVGKSKTRVKVLELAPVNWNKTLEQSEAQQKLASNIYRRVTLSDKPLVHCRSSQLAGSS
jgi:hypothetical protein